MVSSSTLSTKISFIIMYFNEYNVERYKFLTRKQTVLLFSVSHYINNRLSIKIKRIYGGICEYY